MPRGKKTDHYDHNGTVSREEQRIIRMEMKTKIQLLKQRPGDPILQMQLRNMQSELAHDNEIRQQRKVELW